MDTKQILDDHEKRIRALEGGKPSKEKKQESNKGYRGLAGGIRFLIDNKFFNEPKTTKEIMVELKREGYHYLQYPIYQNRFLFYQPEPPQMQYIT